MTINPSLNYLEQVPDELALEISAYFDFSTLLKYAQVSKYFQRISSDKELWQGKIKRDFPYLEKRDEKAYAHAPKALYMGHVRGYFDGLSLLQKSKWFRQAKYLVRLTPAMFVKAIQNKNTHSLITEMRSNPSFSNIIAGAVATIDAIRFAHGYFEYLPRIRNTKSKINMATALGIMGFTGDEKVIKRFLQIYHNLSPKKIKAKILRGAILGGRLNIVELLIDQVLLTNRTELCKHALKHGHFHIMNFIVMKSPTTSLLSGIFPYVVEYGTFLQLNEFIEKHKSTLNSSDAIRSAVRAAVKVGDSEKFYFVLDSFCAKNTKKRHEILKHLTFQALSYSNIHLFIKDFEPYMEDSLLQIHAIVESINNGSKEAYSYFIKRYPQAALEVLTIFMRNHQIAKLNILVDQMISCEIELDITQIMSVWNNQFSALINQKDELASLKSKLLSILSTKKSIQIPDLMPTAFDDTHSQTSPSQSESDKDENELMGSPSLLFMQQESKKRSFPKAQLRPSGDKRQNIGERKSVLD